METQLAYRILLEFRKGTVWIVWINKDLGSVNIWLLYYLFCLFFIWFDIKKLKSCSVFFVLFGFDIKKTPRLMIYAGSSLKSFIPTLSWTTALSGRKSMNILESMSRGLTNWMTSRANFSKQCKQNICRIFKALKNS